MSIAKSEKIYLRLQSSTPFEHYGFKHPMYMDVAEVMNLIKIALIEETGKKMDTVKVLESGILEEHALFEKCDTQKKLVFRIWPVFFAYNKRIEFKIYNQPVFVEKIIRRYLELLAKTNDAELVVKM